MAREPSNLQAETEVSRVRPDVLVTRAAARQHGVLHASELLSCGLSADGIAVRVDNGWLHPMHKGVYGVGHPNPTRDGCYLAAVKACGAGAVLTRWSSAVLHAILEWEDRWPDVVVLGANAPRHPAINGLCTTYLPRDHVTTVRGIPVTTAERTLLDLAAVLPAHRLRRAVRQSQYLKLTTVRSLAAVLAGPGPVRGRAKLARIIATGAAPTQSELEDVVLDLVLRGGFAHPLVNEPLFLDGRRVVPDLCWPEQRLVIEADGPHHDDPFERAADAERQRLLEAHGYRVLRVTWSQAIARAAETHRRIDAAGAPRAVAPSA